MGNTVSGIQVPGSWGNVVGTVGSQHDLVSVGGQPVVPPVNTNIPEGLGVGIQGAINALFGTGSGSGSGFGSLSFLEQIAIVLALVGVLFLVIGKVL
jgi:hypothetical protein